MKRQSFEDAVKSAKDDVVNSIKHWPNGRSFHSLSFVVGGGTVQVSAKCQPGSREIENWKFTAHYFIGKRRATKKEVKALAEQAEDKEGSR